MALASETKERIITAVATFGREQMDLWPVSILASYESDTLYVMLEGITFPAEKACAKDQASQDLLDKYYEQTFDVGKRVLEEEIEKIMGRKIERSTFSVDSIAGNGIIQLRLGEQTSV